MSLVAGAFEMVDLRVQKQHRTEKETNHENHKIKVHTTLRNSFLQMLGYSLHSKPQWVTLLLKIKECP